MPRVTSILTRTGQLVRTFLGGASNLRPHGPAAARTAPQIIQSTADATLPTKPTVELSSPGQGSRTASGMMYFETGPPLHTLWPGEPFHSQGVTSHIFTRTGQAQVGRGLTWFEYHPTEPTSESEPTQTDSPVDAQTYTIVSLECPLSDRLDSPAGETHVHAALKVAKKSGLRDVILRVTETGLLAASPGPLNVLRAEGLSAVVRHIAINL